MNRRDAFKVEPATRSMPTKTTLPVAERAKPTVSRDVAEIARHLTGNPVFVDLMVGLRKEATDRLCNSDLGQPGVEEREIARYMLEALRTIENRMMGIAAETALHAPAADHDND
jgi:hypothetical protein